MEEKEEKLNQFLVKLFKNLAEEYQQFAITSPILTNRDAELYLSGNLTTYSKGFIITYFGVRIHLGIKPTFVGSDQGMYIRGFTECRSQLYTHQTDKQDYGSNWSANMLPNLTLTYDTCVDLAKDLEPIIYAFL